MKHHRSADHHDTYHPLRAPAPQAVEVGSDTHITVPPQRHWGWRCPVKQHSYWKWVMYRWMDLSNLIKDVDFHWFFTIMSVHQMVSVNPKWSPMIWKIQSCEIGPCLGQVQGCGHPVVGSIVNGSFVRTGENHGKPTYKKTEQVRSFYFVWIDVDLDPQW